MVSLTNPIKPVGIMMLSKRKTKRRVKRIRREWAKSQMIPYEDWQHMQSIKQEIRQ